MRIALTGGIACGKSLFAKFLRELGVRVLDADDVVHELEAPGGLAVPMIASRFGSEVIDSDGGVDRRILAEKVFGGDDADARRRELEGILFPLVRRRLADFASSRPGQSGSICRTASGGAISIAIIPLLFESHFDSDYDIILCIASTEEVQILRMMETRGYTRSQAEARLKAQMPVAEKAARSHYVVRNDSTTENLKKEARRAVEWLARR